MFTERVRKRIVANTVDESERNNITANQSSIVALEMYPDEQQIRELERRLQLEIESTNTLIHEEDAEIEQLQKEI
jgi:hypothetical protein